jgi:hypothetical protein
MTSMRGASISIETGPVARFDVPIMPPGAKSIPSIGQKRPVERPRTGARG